MNDFLAEMYGTRETIGSAEDSSDVEKLAEAQILDGILQSEGIDVDQLDDGTILKLAYEIFGDDSQIVKAAAEESEDENEKEDEEEDEEEQSMEEKTAEADMLGRIMAHSMVQELGQIEQEKTAGPVAEAGKALGKELKKVPGRFGKWMKEPVSTAKKLRTPTKFHPGSKGTQTWSRGQAAKETLKRHKGQAAVAAGGLAALGAGGAAAASGGKKKKASAVDHLAEQRAFEILAENGIEIDDGQAKLASAVEQRAWEMLAEAGYLTE